MRAATLAAVRSRCVFLFPLIGTIIFSKELGIVCLGAADSAVFPFVGAPSGSVGRVFMRML